MEMYPERCMRNIRKLVERLHTDMETAYSMMMLTAALMDLRTDDEEVAEIILKDCGYVEKS